MLKIANFVDEQINQDVTQEIMLNQAAGMNPIYSALIAAGQVRPTTTPEITWFDTALPERRSQINRPADDYVAATTDLIVDSVAPFSVGCFVLFEATGEVGRVSAINSGTNTLTVARGIGKAGASVAAADASVADDAYLRNIGYSAGEGSDTPAFQNIPPQKHTNYIQTFRESVRMSKLAAAVATKTEDERARLRRDKFRLLLENIDLQLVHGAGDDDTVDEDGNPVRSIRGLLNFITTHVDNVGGAMSMARFDQFAEEAFAKGADRKFLFAGPTLVRTIHTLYKEKLQVAVSDDAPGLMIRAVATPFGVLDLVVDRAFDGPFAGMGIVVDPEKAYIRPMEGEGRGLPFLRTDLQTGTQDVIIDEWFGEFSFEIGSESAHAVIKGVTAAA